MRIKTKNLAVFNFNFTVVVLLLTLATIFALYGHKFPIFVLVICLAAFIFADLVDTYKPSVKMRF